MTCSRRSHHARTPARRFPRPSRAPLRDGGSSVANWPSSKRAGINVRAARKDEPRSTRATRRIDQPDPGPVANDPRPVATRQREQAMIPAGLAPARRRLLGDGVAGGTVSGTERFAAAHLAAMPSEWTPSGIASQSWNPRPAGGGGAGSSLSTAIWCAAPASRIAQSGRLVPSRTTAIGGSAAKSGGARSTDVATTTPAQDGEDRRERTAGQPRRGSSASRSPSPNRFSDSTRTKIASPGQIAIHGACEMKFFAVLSMLPQLGAGGCWPRPRKRGWPRR